MEVVTSSVEETRALGKRFGAHVEPGSVFALIGDLGAGKTQFVKGVALGIGLSDPDVVTSPTYVLLNRYQGRMPIQHYDLYRTQGGDLESLGFHEFRDESATLVEWGDRTAELGEHLRVEFEVAGETSRRIRFEARGSGPEKLLKLVNLGP